MKKSDPILLVEDDQVDILMVKRALRDLCVDNPLHLAEDGEAALNYLRSTQNRKPAFILLDLNMPRMGGLEFLEIVKNDLDLRRLPVIILTTSQEAQDHFKGLDLGAAGYMVKPLNYEDFTGMLQTIYQYWCLSKPLDIHWIDQ